MRNLFIAFAILSTPLLGFKAMAQNKNQDATIMIQETLQSNGPHEYVSVIDKIFVPAKAISAFYEKFDFIRSFLRQQPGFLDDAKFKKNDNSGNLIIITITTWQSQHFLDSVKKAMVAEMKKAGIDMQEFLQLEKIVMERETYSPVIN